MSRKSCFGRLAVKTASLLLIVCTISLLSSCGGGGSSSTTSGSGPNVPPPPTASLTLLQVTPGNASVAASSTQQFSATGKYSDGSSKDLTSSVLWSSSDTSVASVNNGGLATGVVVGVVTVTAQFGAMQGSATLNITNAGTNLTGITLSPVAASVPVNTAQQFTATGNYNDGSSRDLTALVTWGSSSTAVATVDGNGLVTAVAAGSTNISATLGSISNSTSLTVTAPTISSISVTPVGLTLGIGINQQYTATATYSDGSSQDLVNGVTWSSSTTSVATVNNSGLVTTVGAGTTTITATVGSFSDSSTLTVVAAHLLSIAVSPATPSIAVGTTQQFTATGTFGDTSAQDITSSVLWSSSSAATATINNQGAATSVATGTTTITAALGSVSGSTQLTVSIAHLTLITISPANPRIAKGTSLKFTATGTFSDGSTATNLSGLSWKSSKPNIASIRSSGLAHGKKSGTVTISATASGLTGTATLTVGTGTLVSLAITPATPSVPVGSTQQFTATGSFNDGTTQDITLTTHWSSSSASVATIANAPSIGGLATANGSGTATIGGNSGGVTNSATLTVQ